MILSTSNLIADLDIYLQNSSTKEKLRLDKPRPRAYSAQGYAIGYMYLPYFKTALGKFQRLTCLNPRQPISIICAEFPTKL